MVNSELMKHGLLMASIWTAFTIAIGHAVWSPLCPIGEIHAADSVLLVAAACRVDGKKWEIFTPNRSLIPVRIEHCHPDTATTQCNEVGTYLRFIIANYHRPLARKYVFVHAHDRAWHYGSFTEPDELWPHLGRLLRSRYFRDNAFGAVYAAPSGLAARRNGTCNRGEQVFVYPLYRLLFNSTSMPPEPQSNSTWYCCSTFFAEHTLFWRRPLSEWELLLNRTLEAENFDVSRELVRHFPNLTAAFWCGRVWEYNWHIVMQGHAHTPILRPWQGMGRVWGRRGAGGW
jgi:hypothetical protein